MKFYRTPNKLENTFKIWIDPSIRFNCIVALYIHNIDVHFENFQASAIEYGTVETKNLFDYFTYDHVLVSERER